MPLNRNFLLNSNDKLSVAAYLEKKKKKKILADLFNEQILKTKLQIGTKNHMKKSTFLILIINL
jgi:hypothetical protein